jgi:hypothetical protein
MTRNQKMKYGVVSALTMGGAAANAALPEGATTAFTSLAADAALVIAAAYVAMLAIRGGWLVFDLVKRGLSKSK